jgi:phosphoheptose isomerase
MLQESRPSAPFLSEPEALLRQELGEHRSAFEATVQMLTGPFIETLEILEQGVRRGGKLLLFGNGGSAADAQHIAAELIIRYKADRAAARIQEMHITIGHVLCKALEQRLGLA